MSKSRHRAKPGAVRETDLLVRSFAAEYLAPWKLPWHEHDWHQLAYASRGVLGVRAENGFWIVPPCRAVWIPAGFRHSPEITGPVALRTLYIAPHASRSLPRTCGVVSVSPLLRELILHTVACGMLNRQVPEHKHLAALLLDQLQEVPRIALQLPMPIDPRARRIAEYFESHFDDAVPVSHVMNADRVSRRTLERLFLAETGLTFGRWRQQARLIGAIRLLAEGRSVTDVALDVGYESVSAFIVVFKRFFGTTPSRYFA